jgi:hypothetical protein
MATEQVNRQINIFIESGEAQKVYDKLIAKEKELNKQLAETSDPKRIKQLTDDLKKLEEPISRAAKKVSGELTPSFKELQSTVNTLGARLKRMSVEDADYSKVLKQYNQANVSLQQQKKNLDSLKVSQKAVADEGTNFNRILTRTAEYFGAFTIVSTISEGIKDLFKGSVDEAMEAEEATARFKATLDNLGKTDAFDRLKQKADEMQAKFKYIDNDEVVAVFEKLIDYGKLTEQQINDLTPVIVNFAAKQRISLTEATDVITKSLEGNARALKTYGINVTEASTPAERLKIIMTELKDKVDGAAEAFGNTTAGKIAIAKQSYKDLKEELGNNLLPAYTKVLDITNKVIKGLPLLAEQVKNAMADAFAYFTEGPGAAALNRAERLIAQAKEVEKSVVDKHVASFEDKSADEIRAETIRLQNQIELRKAQQRVAASLGDKDAIKNALEDIKLSKQELDGLFKLLDTKTKTETLGNGNPDYDPTAAKQRQQELEREHQKMLDDQKKLEEDLYKLHQEYFGLNQSEYSKELQAAFDKYNGLKDLAHGNAGELQKIETGLQEALSAIHKKYADKASEEQKKLDAKQQAEREKQLQEGLKKGFEFMDNLGKQLEQQANKTNRTRKEFEDLEIARSTGEKRLELQKQQLDELEQIEVAAAIKTGEDVELVHAKFREKRKQLDSQYFFDQVALYLEFAQTAANFLDAINSVKTNKENAELARDKVLNDKKKANLDKRLKAGLISQEQYQRDVDRLEQQQQQKEKVAAQKQFKRDQAAQEIQAVINGAQGALKTLATFGAPIPPNFLGIAAMAFTVATTVAQIAAIRKQRPPTFGHGGRTSGRSHAQGGMAVVDEYGNKQAEVEGNEGIINKRTMGDRGVYSVTGTPSQIASKINALHGGVNWEGGAQLVPLWKTSAPARMNFAAINNTYQRKHADGGVVAPASTNNDQSEMKQTLASLTVAVNGLLQNGVVAYASLSQFNDQQDRLNRIKADATFKA